MTSSLPRVNCQFRPIILHGHNKPLTTVKYNLDGDLLFTAAKDRKANVFYADSGNKLGTYGFHKGAVWDIDPSWDSEYVVTACADAYARLFRTTTGDYLARLPHIGAVRGVKWADGNARFATCADPFRAKEERSVVSVFDVPAEILNNREPTGNASRDEDVTVPLIPPTIEYQLDLGDKATCVDWTYADEYIIVGTDAGLLIKIDPVSGKEVQRSQAHTSRINRISFNADKTLFVTAGKDQEAKLIDPATLAEIKVYKTDRPVNGAVISPTHPHIIMGGGQEAMNVTTTSSSSGKFESQFFHMLYEEEFGRVKGHFGPINAIAVHPQGRSFASGSEDGYVRLHLFDATYLNAPSHIPDDVAV